MRHRKKGRQLRRTSEQKLALMKNLAKALIERGAIETTEAKAKELRPFVEKLITKAKTGTLHNRRLAGTKVPHRATADKLFQEIGPRFATRKGGYTRILKTGHRKGDGDMIVFKPLNWQLEEPVGPEHQYRRSYQSNIGQHACFLLAHVAVLQANIFKRASGELSTILQIMTIAEHWNDQRRKHKTSP